ARLCRGRPPIERRLGLDSGFGEESQKELARLLTLTASGLKETAQHTVVFQPLVGAGAVDDFAHDDDGTQAALGLIVRRGHLRMAKASEEVFLFGAEQTLAKSFGPLIVQRVFAQGAQLAAQGSAFLFRGPSAPRTFGELVVSLTGGAHEALDVFAELV